MHTSFFAVKEFAFFIASNNCMFCAESGREVGETARFFLQYKPKKQELYSLIGEFANIVMQKVA